MKKIKILDTPWHIAHQYDQMKIPGTEWYWLIQHRRPYGESPRGDMMSKYNIQLVPYYEEGKYDVAILHLDQQCLEESLWQRGKGSLYRELNETLQGIPKIVIMHGTPYYPEQFPCDIIEENYQEKGFSKEQVGCSSELINKVNEVVGDNIMIVNSERASEQWGRGIPIIHGMDKDEWVSLDKEPRVVTMISPGGLDKYYDREFLEAVRDRLEEKHIMHCHITVDVKFNNWQDYKEFLGRSLIYFNPTRESPMPRSRTEAMLSGCCVVTTPHQDTDKFIRSGENGIIVKRNPDTVVKLIEGLFYDYKTALEIGKRGKETAEKIFDHNRYLGQWRTLLEKVVSGEKVNDREFRFPSPYAK